MSDNQLKSNNNSISRISPPRIASSGRLQLAARRHPTYLNSIADLRIPALRCNKDMR
jgi:hypothetical protein